MLVYFSEKSILCDTNVINFSLNVNKFGMLIDNIQVGMTHDFGCYGHHFVGQLWIP